MRRFLVVLLAATTSALAAETSTPEAAPAVAAGASRMPPLADYVGAEGCGKCHEDKYNGWKRTFHSTVVQDAKARPYAVLGDFSQPGIGFSLDEVEFTVGVHWNQRYMKRIGSDYFVLPKSWSISSRRWESCNVWRWKKMPYSRFCQGCHVTRYDPTDGSMVEHTIGCESCHGPGRLHAESGGKAAIVNPEKLVMKMEYICAACHVRGKDPSGEYPFPVGFVPGRDLARYYIPIKVLENEAVGDALLREFRTWWGSMGSSHVCSNICNGKCNDKSREGTTRYCIECHKYGDAYSRHTNHDSKAVDLQCFDCHKKVALEEEGSADDVHSVSYFLVHQRTCYDKDYAKACMICHAKWTEDKVKEMLSTWSGRSTVHD